MNPKTQAFVKGKLREYYSKKGVKQPNDLKSREFGFGNEKKIDYRHHAFGTPEELKMYFVDKAPLYASYSSAYYEFPDARPMQKKNFKGADLIFEFDSDCTHAKETLTCTACMDEMKNETTKLIEDFLVPDFGFSQRDISVAFSGSRGFHIHVKNELVRQLSQDARREIIDYVQAKDLKTPNWQHGPTPQSGGWYGKIARLLCDYVEHPEHYTIRSKEVAGKTEAERRALLEKMKTGNYDQFRRSGVLWKRILEIKKVHLSANIDQSVTFDLSRLIRLPSTIHGGSSLIACEVRNLDKFEPFKDAVAFYNPPVEIKALHDIPMFTLKGQSFGAMQKGSAAQVPEYAAMFLMCKGMAEIGT